MTAELPRLPELPQKDRYTLYVCVREYLYEKMIYKTAYDYNFLCKFLSFSGGLCVHDFLR